ncbi:FkbM family methyltransferase [Bordetella sp. 2513F-2]
MTTALPSPVRAVRTRYGHTVLIDPADYIGRQILRHGLYDRATIAALRDILQRLRPRTVLDVGANIGNHALALADLCERLLAFEPGRHASQLLRRNLEENGMRHAVVLDYGLSDTDAQAMLHVNGRGNLGASSLHHCDPAGMAEPVQLRAGDACLQELGIADVDFIKVDVEGHERQVVQGLARTIAGCRPLVQLEWDAASSDRQWLADPSTLQALFPGYDIYAYIWNSNVAYWAARPWGRVRRLAVRLGTRKRRVLTRFDPEAHRERVNDVLLVPREKAGVLGGLVYR